jgi:hypothetical protein
MINVLGHGLTYGLKLSLLFFHRVSSGNSQKKVVAFLAGFFLPQCNIGKQGMCKKLYFEMSKILTKRSTCTSPLFMRIRQVSRKTDIFVCLCKKKIVVSKALFLASNFTFLDTPHNKPIFHQTNLWECST